MILHQTITIWPFLSRRDRVHCGLLWQLSIQGELSMWRNAIMSTSVVVAAGLMAPSHAEAHGWFPLPRAWPPVFETAVRVDALSAAGFADGCPIETADGLSLFIASNRDGDPNNIWAADRASLDAPWQAPRKLDAPINTTFADFCPTPVRGRSLMFVSTRTGVPGGCVGEVGGDMYISRQSPAGGWSEPVNLGCAPNGPNTLGAERSPSLVETPYGTFLFYSTNGTTGHQDIHFSVMRKDGTFGPGRVIEALSTPSEDIMPNVRARDLGGYEIVFSSNRPSSSSSGTAQGAQDVYISFAWFLPGPWSAPVNVGTSVNTAGVEQRSTLSDDGKRLYFGRDGDIFVSERVR
jgi:hypothetical protein